MHTLIGLSSLVTTQRSTVWSQSTPQTAAEQSGEAREGGGRMAAGGVVRMLRPKLHLYASTVACCQLTSCFFPRMTSSSSSASPATKPQMSSCLHPCPGECRVRDSTLCSKGPVSGTGERVQSPPTSADSQGQRHL